MRSWRRLPVLVRTRRGLPKDAKKRTHCRQRHPSKTVPMAAWGVIAGRFSVLDRSSGAAPAPTETASISMPTDNPYAIPTPEDNSGSSDATATPESDADAGLAGEIYQHEFQPEHFGITDCRLLNDFRIRVVITNQSDQSYSLKLAFYGHVDGSNEDWQEIAYTFWTNHVEPNHQVTLNIQPLGSLARSRITALRCIADEWRHI